MLPPEPRDKREVCPLHGWVGRRAFLRDRHDLCEAPAETSVEDDDAEHDDEDVDEIEPEAEDEEGDDVIEAEPTPRAVRQPSPRRRGIPPKKTVAVRRITRVELDVGRAELRVLGADGPYDRPKTRLDCAGGPRPCPYVACKHNLYLDISETGSIILNFPHLEPGEMPPDQSCSLDLAARGGMTLEEIATVTNLTRERIRQVELKALIRRARPAALALGLRSEDAAAAGSRRNVGPGQDLVETGIDGELPSDIATLLAGK
jgi:Sigma-70, region 4